MKETQNGSIKKNVSFAALFLLGLVLITILPLRAQRVYVRVEYMYLYLTSVYNISPDDFNIWEPPSQTWKVPYCSFSLTKFVQMKNIFLLIHAKMKTHKSKKTTRINKGWVTFVRKLGSVRNSQTRNIKK